MMKNLHHIFRIFFCYYSFYSLWCGYRFIQIFLLCRKLKQVDLTFLSLTFLFSLSQIWNDLTAVLLAGCLLFGLAFYFFSFIFFSCKSSFSFGWCLKGLGCSSCLAIFFSYGYFWCKAKFWGTELKRIYRNGPNIYFWFFVSNHRFGHFVSKRNKKEHKDSK